MTDLAFRDVQKQTGAIFPDTETGTPAALHFGDPAAEYRKAKNECALFDLSDRTNIKITGKDRVAFLNNFCTNDIKMLNPGQGCEAFITSIKGRVLGHVFVFVEQDAIWLESVPHATEPLLQHLGKYVLAEEVELHDRSAEYGELFISGPKSAEKLTPLISNVADFGQHAHGMMKWNEISIAWRRIDFLNEPGFLLSAARDHLGDVWRLLCETIKPAGADVFHALRIESGFPLYGIDVSEENIAQEVGRTKQAISFTKGCYLGQEPISRIDALGHVNRELCGLKLSTGSAPLPGSAVKSEDGSKEIGSITSSVLSPIENTPLALAYLKSQYLTPGTSVSVHVDDNSIPASVFQPEA